MEYNNTNNDTSPIITGIRGLAFKNFIVQILKKSDMKMTTINDLLDNYEGMEMYEAVFTHPSVDEHNNYEFYELVGDSIANNSVVQFLIEKYPQLQHPKYVKIIARLKINLFSKQTYYRLAQNLGMWDYISARENTKNTKMKNMLEDVFEAFFGATCILVNKRTKNGLLVCYKILRNLLQEQHISFAYEDLYDAKTRLKEIFDMFKNLGKLEYSNEYSNNIHHVFITMGGVVIGSGSSSLKIDAQQKAAQKALDVLKYQYNVFKPIPKIYQELAELSKT